MSFFSSLWNVAGSTVTSLASVALLGYASKLLSDNTNNSSTGETPIVDAGVRLQLNPSTDNQIPILYGEAYFGGNITDAQLSTDYKTMTYCLTLAETTGEKISDSQQSAYTFKGVYFNNNRVVFKADGVTVDYTLDSAGNQDISMRDLVKVYFYKGLTGIQPEGKSGTTPAPSTVMPGWTAGTHPMTGLIYAIVQVTYSRDKGVSGLPDCAFHVKNSMSLPGDVLVDYMTNTRYGAGIAAAEIEGATFVALNSYATTGFTYTAIGGTTASGQIQINGLVDPATVVLDNMEELAKAASSWITYDIHTGQWAVIINKAGTSIASFNDGNIIGDIAISGTSLTQLNNVANIKYSNTDILDKTDFVKVSIPAGDLYQNEPQTTLERTLPFTTQQVVAMKIGLQELKQARVDKIITFSTDYSYLNLRAGDLVDVTSSVYGYTNKMFRIITVEETEDDNGSIVLNFTCLEYDAGVYEYDIQEYLVETDDGILGIGAIGKPDVPVVTKTEQANVPKIVISADVPSGVVDAIEYWLTFDVGVGNDSARTYIHIGTYSNTNGTSLTENETVSYTYSGLSQSNFFVKVRGVNSVATGPYSEPTGLIAYNPIVVADTVSNDPVVGLDNQLMSLGLLALLNNLDGIYKGIFGSGSLLDKIMDGIKEVTGVDLKTGGPGVPGADGADGAPGKDAEVCTLTFGAAQYPPDRKYLEDPETPYPNEVSMGPKDPNKVRLSGTIADYADPNGDYYFSIADGVVLSIGSGDIKLYKSDGTLVQTVSASSLVIDTTNGIVKIPFATRSNKTDYYILMDEGVIKGSNGCVSPAINTSQGWNFHTDTPSPRPVLLPPPPTTIPTGCPALKLVKVVVKKFENVVSPDNLKTDIETNIAVIWNQGISLKKTGTITIQSAGGVHQTIDLSKTFETDKVSEELVVAQGPILYVNPTVDFQRGTKYWMTITANALESSCKNGGNAAITDSTTITWTTDNGPTSQNILPVTNPNKSANEQGIGMKFDQPVLRGTGTINIKDSSGAVIRSIPATDPAVTVTN